MQTEGMMTNELFFKGEDAYLNVKTALNVRMETLSPTSVPSKAAIKETAGWQMPEPVKVFRK